jgi:hypothetical protein
MYSNLIVMLILLSTIKVTRRNLFFPCPLMNNHQAARVLTEAIFHLRACKMGYCSLTDFNNRQVMCPRLVPGEIQKQRIKRRVRACEFAAKSFFFIN